MPLSKPIAVALCTLLAASFTARAAEPATMPAPPTLAERFANPPAAARPQVYWFWMGKNVSEAGITKDLQALKEAGFGGTTMCHLADVCTPWAGNIGGGPPSDIVEYQSESWWKLIRFAAAESKRLGLEFGMHNCAGYESSGGTWITPELSMQEVVFTQTPVKGGEPFAGLLPRPKPDAHANQPFPVKNSASGKVEKPIIEARQTYYKDIAVLALPAAGDVAKEKIINLTDKMAADGTLKWTAPEGDWIIYRFGHTTTGASLQPCQWDAMGLECDKMSEAAVQFHLHHILGETRKHLGDLMGTGLQYIWFDSYEAGTPGWTPKMTQEFLARRGYDLTPFLPTLAKRTIVSGAETKKFQADFQQTIRDLYRDVYFATIQRECHAAGVEARAEPYTGPWKIAEAVPAFDQVAAEFWTNTGVYKALPELAQVVSAARAAKMPVISAEAFTGQPKESQWDETPAWLKPIGDGAFCDGINRLMLHRFVHQPFADDIKPGVAMGQWGTHFDRTQTWWEPGKAWVQYLQRCQAVLQFGELKPTPMTVDSAAGVTLKSIHRGDAFTDLYFVSNQARIAGSATCSFDVTGKLPELWDPVTGLKRPLPAFTITRDKTTVPLQFAEAQSYFIIFEKVAPLDAKATAATNFPPLASATEITGSWSVHFDPAWGGPDKATFDKLDDWITRPEEGIKYYSGTATYSKTFDLPDNLTSIAPLWLDLGKVAAIAQVRLNGKDLGVVWTAPWRIDISSAVKLKDNQLEIKVTNVWANRLIGDGQQPADCQFVPGDRGFGGPLQSFPDWFTKGTPRPSKGRFTFTTWNYFTKGSPLVSSGLLGPVKVLKQAE